MWECVWKKSNVTPFVILNIFISNCNLITHFFPVTVIDYNYIYIYIYAFSRHFYPKRLTVHSGYTFFLSVYVFPGNWTHNLLRH